MATSYEKDLLRRAGLEIERLQKEAQILKLERKAVATVVEQIASGEQEPVGSYMDLRKRAADLADDEPEMIKLASSFEIGISTKPVDKEDRDKKTEKSFSEIMIETLRKGD